MTCRWCYSPAHSIENCPEVENAFGPDDDAHFCRMCGAELPHVTTRSTLVYCAECREYSRLEAERRKAAGRNCQRVIVRQGNRKTTMRIVEPKNSGYVRGGIIVGGREALEAGYLEPGMKVRYLGQEWVVKGEPLKPQRLVNTKYLHP